MKRMISFGKRIKDMKNFIVYLRMPEVKIIKFFDSLLNGELEKPLF